MVLSELRDALGDLLEVDTDRYPAQVRTRHLNNAILGLALDLEGPWVHDTGTINVTAGSESVDPVADMDGATLTFSQPELVYYQGSSGPLEVERLLWSEFTAAYRLATVDPGELLVYSVRGGRLWLGPVPADDVVLTVDYMGLPVDLSSDNDQNDWTREAPDLVLAAAAVRACAWLLEEERISVFERQVQELSERLLIHWSHDYNRNRVMEAEEV